MKYKYSTILILVLCSINIWGQTADNVKKPKYKRVSEAYGYLTGQEYSLSLIKKEFPHLELSIIKAQSAFNSTFGKAKEPMKSYLKEYLGEREFTVTDEKLITQVKELLSSQVFTEEIAINFIADVENRSKGNVDTPILETLLSFQYSDNPQRELLEGFTFTFKTQGHPKSKNTNWQIQVPKSWKAEEADRPNIIQKFISDYGSGNQNIMLMVNEMDLPKGYKVTKAELNEMFTEKEMKDMVPDGGKYISFTKMTLDNNIGGMVEFELTRERLDIRIKIRMVQFMFIRGNKMYMLQGSVASEKGETDLSTEMKKYLPLYKHVANTIVVIEQYK